MSIPKKQTQRFKKLMIILLIIIFVTCFYILALYKFPAFVFYSDDNTDTYVGKVTSMYTESEYTGYKNRQRTIVYIELEQKETFWVSYLTLSKAGIIYDDLKEIMLNKNVEIKTPKNDKQKIVSISVDDYSIFTYDDINKTSQSNRVGLTIMCIIVILFATLYFVLRVH